MVNRKLACATGARISLLCGLMLGPVAAPLAADGVVRLSDIVVTATGSEQDLRDAPASMTVIDAETIQRRASRDVLDAIQDSPGITLYGRGLSGRKVLTIRGMNSEHSLVMVDGRRVSASDDVFGHSDYQYNWVPIDSIERIEVVRGPMSSLYGSEALGGVINIITKGVEEEWGGSARLLAGAHGHSRGGEQRNVQLSASGPLVPGLLGMRINAGLDSLDDVADKDDRDISEMEGKEVRSTGLSLTLTPMEGQRFDLSYSASDEERWRHTLHRNNPPLHLNTYEIGREQIALDYRGRFGVVDSTVRVYRSELEQSNRTDNTAVAATTGQTLIDEVFDGRVVFPLGREQLITVGAEQRKETLIHPAFAAGKGSADHRALYLQDEIGLTDTLTLTLGLRSDKHELFGTETSPRAYLVYHLSDRLSLKGGYGHGFRAPTLKQISPEYQFAGAHSFRGNPDLKPETSDSYELGGEWVDEGWKASLTVFRNDIEGLIATRCVENCHLPFGRVFDYINVNKARIDGIETGFDTSLGERFSLGFNHVYLDTEDRDSGKPLSNRPDHTVNLKLGWDHRPLGLHAELRSQYTGKQRVMVTETAHDLPAYTQWHASLSKTLSQQVSLRGGIENLTDTRPADKSEHFSYPLRGRLFYVGVDARF